jgi:RNA polymerase sigma-70 factor (ECF subfamily)
MPAQELKAIEQERLALVRRIADGDQLALARLYDSTSRQAYGLALRILADASAAEEVALEVFTQVWNKASSYDPRRGTPSAWILTMTRSRAIDRLRSTRGERRRVEPLATAATAEAGGASPEESAAEAERRARIRAALADLPPEQRQVIELAYFGGLTHTEIAEHLDQPLGTVKTRTRLGLIRLRQSLGAEGGREA